MEINAANVAWRKFFLWEARLRRQEKIGELSTEEIQEITGNAIPVTKKNKVRNENNQRYVPV